MGPVVLVTADRRDRSGFGSGPRVRPKRSEAWITEAYVDAIRDAGGLPLVLAPGCRDVDAVLARVDGVVLTGGHFDIHPRHYGALVDARLDRVEEARTVAELALARACLERDIPVLGICGGMQAMAVAAGGSLIQDLPKPDEERPELIDHEQPHDPAEPPHRVRIEAPAAPTPEANSVDPMSEERAKAERLARVVVSDIVLYQGDRFETAVQNGNWLEMLETEIEEGRKIFQQRIDERVREERDFLMDELYRVAEERVLS